MHIPPSSAVSAGLRQVTHEITMSCSDAASSGRTFTRTVPGCKEPTWKVVHLMKDGGSGLSGGWRGFAFDNVSCLPKTLSSLGMTGRHRSSL